MRLKTAPRLNISQKMALKKETKIELPLIRIRIHRRFFVAFDIFATLYYLPKSRAFEVESHLTLGFPKFAKTA